MKARKHPGIISSVVCLCLAALPAAAQTPTPTTAPTDAKPTPTATAAAADSTADTGGKITTTGLLDFYYQYDMNHPAVGTNVAGRSFDIKNDQFAFSLAEVNVVRTPSKALPVGFTVTGTLGKTADIVHATEPGGTNTYKYLQQVFATFTTPGRTPITVNFGKFVTWMGYEVIESSSNDNYSRSFLFNYAIPFYHMGGSASVPLSSQATLTLYLVNGWNDVEDDNGNKSYGAQLALTPSKTFSATLNYIGGVESTAAGFALVTVPAGEGTTTVAPNYDTNVINLVLVANPTSKLKLAADLDYGDASSSVLAGGTWSGEAIYGRYQISGPLAFALRLEHFEDTGGLRTGAAQNMNEITATLEHNWKNNLISRLEFRHDHGQAPGFFPSGGGGAGKSQDTLTIGEVVKF